MKISLDLSKVEYNLSRHCLLIICILRCAHIPFKNTAEKILELYREVFRVQTAVKLRLDISLPKGDWQLKIITSPSSLLLIVCSAFIAEC